MIIDQKFFESLDEMYLTLDKGNIRRSTNLRLIPQLIDRKGGKISYAEWAHVIGVFQTIIYQTLGKKSGNQILDIGCGTGLVGISCEPFVRNGGFYTGMDIQRDQIEFCKKHYTESNFKFIHLNHSNPMYVNEQPNDLEEWPIGNDSIDMATAVSVWTHLREEEAKFYFKEIKRVLKPGGKAIITFFYLDELYQKSLQRRSDRVGRFHGTNQMDWIFDEPAYDSQNWFSRKKNRVPENAIGVNEVGINELQEISGMKLRKVYTGNWKERPGIFFQDILIFNK
jgi:SAM-dependent methyltransferase